MNRRTVDRAVREGVGNNALSGAHDESLRHATLDQLAEAIELRDTTDGEVELLVRDRSRKGTVEGDAELLLEGALALALDEVGADKSADRLGSESDVVGVRRVAATGKDVLEGDKWSEKTVEGREDVGRGGGDEDQRK